MVLIFVYNVRLYISSNLSTSPSTIQLFQIPLTLPSHSSANKYLGQIPMRPCRTIKLKICRQILIVLAAFNRRKQSFCCYICLSAVNLYQRVLFRIQVWWKGLINIYIHQDLLSCPMEHSHTYSLLKFEDHERTTTGLTPSLCPPPSKFAPEKSQDHSTYIYEQAQEELPLPPEYRLHSRILKHTQITQKMRARLRVFLMAQCAKQWMFRETCALACTYADLFFQKQGAVQPQQFQSMIIACLMVAAKAREGIFPIISERAFSRQELLELQVKVITTLSFKLNPPTYYSFAQRTVYLWDCFTGEQQSYNFKLTQQLAGVNSKLRRFYEQLDCVFMALDSLEFELEELVINFFYLHARMLNVYELDSPSSLTNKEFCRLFYPQNDKFSSFFEKFLLRYWKRCILIESAIGCYLKPFLRVGSVKKEWALSQTKQHYQRIRTWDQLQTLPSDCYSTVKAILTAIKQTQ